MGPTVHRDCADVSFVIEAVLAQERLELVTNLSLVGFEGSRVHLHAPLAEYEYINTVSYSRFLVDRVGLQKETIEVLDAFLRVLNGFTGWNHSVMEALAAAAPGLPGMGWLAGKVHSLAKVVVAGVAFQAQYFPDGNASVARLLVHRLIPAAAPDATGFKDIATSRFVYEALDRDDSDTRLRLSSTVVGVRLQGDEKVEVDYVRAGEALRITGDHCILACYNRLIPHLCPDLPSRQKEALRYGAKVPLVYANVLLKDGHAFSKLDANLVACPHDPFTMVSCAPITTTGGYEPPRGPDDPMVVLMMASPTPAPEDDESLRDLHFSRRERSSRKSLPPPNRLSSLSCSVAAIGSARTRPL